MPIAFPPPRAGGSDIFISGIDTSLGLKRIGGNRARYEGLLRKFADQQKDAAKVMQAALSRGDAATAERTAHSLKGAAGTLGAVALAEVAAEAENAVKTRHGIPDAIAALSRALDPVIEAIHAALPEDGNGNGATTSAYPPSAILEPLGRLKELLESDDGEAADFLLDAKASLAGVLTPAEIKRLNDSVGKFDFETALACLSGIATRLSLNLDGQ